MSRRLLLSYLGLTLVLLLSLEVPLAINYGRGLRSELSSDLVRDGFAIAGFAEDTLESGGNADLNELASRYAERIGGRVVIVEADGRAVADSAGTGVNDDFSTRPEIEAALRGEVAVGTRHSETVGGELLYAAVPVASGGIVHGAVRITYSTAQINQRWLCYLVALLAIGIVSMAAAALLGIFFARWVTRPLSTLERAASELGSGKLDTRAEDSSGPPEVRSLATTFNAMAGQLDDLMQAQEAFVADASHQLRTPLAALRLQIENLQADLALDGEGPTDPEQVAADVNSELEAALTEIERLSRIVDGLLALARADRSGTSTAAPLDVDTMFEERRAAWEPFTNERGLTLSVEPSSLHVQATEDRLSQALDNLIANSIDATPPGGEIIMRAGAGRSHLPGDAGIVSLHVIDEGPGLSEHERLRAFDRFWRGRPAGAASGDSLGDSELGGSGIGLAIARKLVRADHGEVELRAAPDHGVDAVILLPAVRHIPSKG